MADLRMSISKALSKIVDGNEADIIVMEAERGIIDNLLEVMKKRYGDRWRKIAYKLVEYLEAEDPEAARRLIRTISRFERG
ncbi:MAG: hypothetical protein N3F65_04430 [Nitrososphaeria archaeon]|nr:hypothetical protein [Nitrososphaeria archaeon]